MGRIERDILTQHRPHGFVGKTDRYLADVAGEIRRLWLKEQRKFELPVGGLDGDELARMAVILTEFAEDMHCDLGLWTSLEACQARDFKTPLPFFVASGEAARFAPFDSRRIQFLLWSLLPGFFDDDLILNPHHENFRRMGEAVSAFLAERFASMPRDSGLKKFLARKATEAYQVKTKLLWLGTGSYLFRQLFENYAAARQSSPDDIGVTDDFLCAESTLWSGLGATDILPGVLGLPDEDRQDVLGWSQRHTAPFRVLEKRVVEEVTESIVARNVVNGKDYFIRMDIETDAFNPGEMMFGSLIRWRGEWYWSGQQRPFGRLSEIRENEMRSAMFQESSLHVYCYCREEADQASEWLREHRARFVAHYGNDFVVFPDGAALAESEGKRIEAEWAAMPKLERARLESSHGLEGPRFASPSVFINHEQRIGVFFNPLAGVESFLLFEHVESGMKKRGMDLDEDEIEAIQSMVIDSSISPEFVQRIVAEYGPESITAVFFLREQPQELALYFLLRRYKGGYYRSTYPRVVISNGK